MLKSEDCSRWKEYDDFEQVAERFGPRKLKKWKLAETNPIDVKMEEQTSVDASISDHVESPEESCTSPVISSKDSHLSSQPDSSISDEVEHLRPYFKKLNFSNHCCCVSMRGEYMPKEKMVRMLNGGLNPINCVTQAEFEGTLEIGHRWTLHFEDDVALARGLRELKNLHRTFNQNGRKCNYTFKRSRKRESLPS